MTRKQMIMSVILASVAGIFLYVSHAHDQAPIIKNSMAEINAPESLKERERWSEMIDEIGSEKTYEQFKKEYASYAQRLQHGGAHMIGDLLYKKDGIPGIGVCDSTFSFGCYHGFFSQAVAKNGIAVIPALDKICVEKYGPLNTGCQHGIGHGLIEYFGPGGLIKALEACELTTRENELFGCRWGAFMEYNLPTMIDENHAYQQPNKINPENLYEPCNTIVPEKFRKACYFELSSWWEGTGKIDYQRMGELCNSIGDDRYEEPCYIGAGNQIVTGEEYDVTRTIETCRKMPDKQGEIMCRSGAAYGIKAFTKESALREKICEGLDKNDEQLCLQKSQL